jgi:hypothetical protein
MARAIRRRLSLAVCVVTACAALCGCTRLDAANGRQVAESIAGHDHVTSADASVDADTWSPSIDVSVMVDPDISDGDLADLALSADRTAADAGWSDRFIGVSVGQGHSFSTLGGAATLGVFLGMRHDDRYLVASARGSGDCAGFFCVVVADDEPTTLLRDVRHLLDLARSAGGVQSNLTFGASDPSGRWVVEAEPGAGIDTAVALWQRIADAVPLLAARAWPVEPVGDLPSLQSLDLIVPDADAQAAAEAIASLQSAVEVTVTVGD